MPDREPLDYLPLWGLFPVTVAIVLLSLEAGFRLGRYRLGRSAREKDSPVGETVAATLGLLAFTFGMAASRFDSRRGVLLDEANAIGTAYLRTGLLPEPQRTHSRTLLREYVDVRLEAVRPEKTEQAISRSERLHGRLWEHAEAVAEKNPGSVVVGLYIQSLNEVIDVHSKRVTLGLRSRIPASIWFALYFVTILAMAAMSYHGGLTGASRSLAVFALALTFSGVIVLIADLDRPQEGLLRVSQQAMIDLQNTLNAPGLE